MIDKIMKRVCNWRNEFYLAMIFVAGALITSILGNTLAASILLTLTAIMVLIGGLLLFYTLHLMSKEDEKENN